MSAPTENPLISIGDTIAFDVRDWAEDKRLAWIYGIVLGWDDEADGANNGAMDDLQRTFGWNDDTVARLRRLHEAYERLESIAAPRSTGETEEG